jgi:hypothetical protein
MATFNNIALLKEVEFPDAENTVIAYYDHNTDTTLNLVFAWDENSNLQPNGGTIIAKATGGTGRHILIKVRHDVQNEVPIENIGYYDLLWFGGSPTSYSIQRTKNQDAFSAGYVAAVVEHPTISGYKPMELYVPPGIYLIDDEPLPRISPAHNGLIARGIINETTDGQGRPIVDEATSSVFKKKDFTSHRFEMLWVTKKLGETLENISLRQLAFNGNRDNQSDGACGTLVRLRSEAGGSDNSPVFNILLDTVWAYKVNDQRMHLIERDRNFGAAFSLPFDNVTFINCVSHHTWGHGTGTGNTFNVKVINYRSYMVSTKLNGDWNNSGYCCDFSQDANRTILENFDLRDSGRTFKTSRDSKTVIVRNGVIENSGQLPNPSSTAHGMTQTFAPEQPTLAHVEVDNVLIKNSRNMGYRFAADTNDQNGGILRIGRIICDANDQYNVFFNRRAESISIDHLISRNFNGSGAESIRLHNSGSFLDEMVVRSGHFYDNQKTAFTVAGGTLVIANTRAANASDFLGAGTIRFARLTDVNGSPITNPDGTGTRVQLPICDITDVQVSGDDLVLTSTITQGTDSLSGATVKFIYAKKGVFPHRRFDDNWDVINNHVEFPGNASIVSGTTYSLTVENYATILEADTEYWIFAEITLTNGDKSIEYRDYETGEYLEADFGEASTPGKVGNDGRLPANEAVGVSVNPTYTIPNVVGEIYYEARVGLGLDNGDVIELVREQSNITKQDGATTSFTLGGALALETTHYWQVRAVNPAATPQEGEWSDAWGFVTVAELAILPPGRLEPLNASKSNPTTVTIKGEAVGGASGYDIQASVNSDMSTPFVDVTDVENPEWELTDLDYDTTVYWRMRSLQDATTGEWSRTMSFSTRVEPQKIFIVGVISAGAIEVEPNTSDIPTAISDPENNEYIYITALEAPGELALDVATAVNDRTNWIIPIWIRVESGSVQAKLQLKEGDTVRATVESADITATFQRFDLLIPISNAVDVSTFNNLRLTLEMVGGVS